MPRIGVVYVDVRGNTTGFDRDVKKAAADAERSLRGISTASARAAFGTLTAAASTAAVAVGGIGITAIRANTDFSKAISGVGAVANATAEDMERLRVAALKAGADTSFSASEAAVAEAELAKAGISVNDILGGALKGTLGLAAAGQLDLADAATITAQALNIFGLAGDQTTRVADVLAAGANKSAADVGQLGDALRQGGLVADQVGLSLEDTVGVLSLFADNALIGSDAGTSFKTMLQRLVPQSEEQATAMEELGLKFFDAAGGFVGIDEVAQQLQRSLGGLNDEQRQAALTTLFGSDAVRAATLLMDAGADGVREYTAAVSDMGAAERMAAILLDNLAGDIEAFKGSVETALIGLGDAVDPAMRSLTSGGTELVNVFNRFASSPAFAAVKRNVAGLSGDIEAVFDDLALRLEQTLGGITSQDIDRVFNRGRDAARKFRDAIDGVEGAVGGLSVGLAGMAARSIPALGGLVPAFNPIVAAIAGIVLQSEAGRDALSELGEAFADVGGTVGTEMADTLEEITPAVIELVEAVTELAVEVLPLLADVFTDVADVAGPLVADGLGLAADAIGFVADNAEIALPVIAGLVTAFKFQAIAGVAQTLGNIGTSIRDIGIAAQLTVQNGGGIRDFVELLGGTGISAAAGIAGAAVAGLGYAFLKTRQQAADAKAEIDAYADAIKETGSSVEGAAKVLSEWLRTPDNRNADTINAIAEALADAGLTARDLADAFDAGGDASVEFQDRLAETARDLEAQRLGYESYAAILRELETIDPSSPRLQPVTEDMYAAKAAGDQLNSVLDTQYDRFEQGRAAQELYDQIVKENRTSVERLTAAIDALSAAQDRQAGRAKNVADAELRATETAERLAEARAAEGGATGSTTGTEAQRRTFAAIRDNVQANVDLALAQQAVGASAEDTALKLVAQEQTLAKLRDQGVITAETYASLVEQFSLTPEEIQTTVTVEGAEASRESIEDLQASLDAIDDQDFVASVETLIEQPSPANLAAAQRLIAEYFRRNPVQIPGQVKWSQDGTLFGIFPGLRRADGGFVAFGSGGMRSGRLPDQAVIQPPVAGGGLVQWAEPETGGEAFIPMGSNKREKALPVLDEVARRFGYTLASPVAFADGGYLDVAAFGGSSASELTRFVLALNGSDPRRYQYQATSATPGVGRWWDTETGRVLGYSKSKESEVYRTAFDAATSPETTSGRSSQSDAPTGIESTGEPSTRDMDPRLREFFEALAPKEQPGLPDLTPVVDAIERLGGNLRRPNNYTVGRIEGSAARRQLAAVLEDDRAQFEVSI